MNTKKYTFILIAVLGIYWSTANAENNNAKRLPSQATLAAIQALETSEESPLNLQDIKGFRLSDKYAPNAYIANTNESTGNTSVPLIVPNTMLLQLAPNLDQKQISDMIRENDFRVVEKFPNTGQIKVETDLSRYYKPRLIDNSANDTLLRGSIEASTTYAKDPRIKAATPDFFINAQSARRTQSISNLYTPNAAYISNMPGGEIKDWGIVDIQADKLWQLDGAQNGLIIGIIDTGFATHEDIVFSGIDEDIDISNHGNHVAGIACAQHNGVGIMGVIPHCFVTPRIGKFYPIREDGNNIVLFMTRFSQILGTFDEFIPTREDIKTYNVSLGYNWKSNFGVNPDVDDSAIYRQLVAMQGEMLLSILELAAARGKTIFSAAGNDSHGLPEPIGAKYASPFNWAAITARERGISNNGIIVEAHNQNGERATFSNIGGHISCPGVDITSAIAFLPNSDQPANNVYGKMSGTSMASPYCAAAHGLLSLVRPGYSASELVECMINFAEPNPGGAPRLKLQNAIGECPKKDTQVTRR